MQKLLAVLLLVALEAWSSGEKQKHIFFLEKKTHNKKTQKQNKQTTKKKQKKHPENKVKTNWRMDVCENSDNIKRGSESDSKQSVVCAQKLNTLSSLEENHWTQSN